MRVALCLIILLNLSLFGVESSAYGEETMGHYTFVEHATLFESRSPLQRQKLTSRQVLRRQDHLQRRPESNLTRLNERNEHRESHLSQHQVEPSLSKKERNISPPNILFSAFSEMIISTLTAETSKRVRNLSKRTLKLGVKYGAKRFARGFINRHLHIGSNLALNRAMSDTFGHLVMGGIEWITHGQIDPRGVLGNVASTLGGALGSFSIYSLVSTYGIASTGASISSLSGAAATKATLAWLGGGSIASGGGGMVVGQVVLDTMSAGIGTLVAVGTTYLYGKWEESELRSFQRDVLLLVIERDPDTLLLNLNHAR